MNFLLNEDQQKLFEAILDFAVAESDGGARRDAFEGDMEAVRSAWRGQCEMGIPGILIPEEHGGMGLTLVELALACEALGYAGMPGPALFHCLAAHAIALGCDEATRARLLPLLASGEKTAAFAWGEGDGCWMPDALEMDISASGICGTKRHVLCGAIADIFIVMLKEGRVVLVEGGAVATAEAGVDPCRPLANVAFDAPGATELQCRDGDLGGYLHGCALALLAADSFGAARRCLDMTLDYLKTRKQFGVVVGSFQAVKHQLADLFAEVEASRGLYWYAALSCAEKQADAGRSALLAKAHIGDLACHVARECAKLHGGIGFTWEHELHIWLRRAMANSAIGGSGQTLRRAFPALSGWVEV